jgi:hypothetical protein
LSSTIPNLCFVVSCRTRRIVGVVLLESHQELML